MKKILIAIGTRPEAIKIAPIMLALRQRNDVEVTLVSSGQHAELFQDALGVFNLKADYDLGIMTNASGLAPITARALEGYTELFARLTPDIVVVHGDTTSTLSAALAAYYNRIPIAHVEAGLRTYDKYASFPEETNRRMVATIADLHYAPSATARDHLLSEHIPADSIEVTGNTVIDALRWVLENTSDPLATSQSPLAQCAHKPFILLTAHRRESWGEPFRACFSAIQSVAASRPDLQVIFPLHPNPKILREVESMLDVPNIHLTAALDYHHFAFLLKRALLVVTDSGGIQEETSFLGKPTFVIRTATERTEALEAGTAKLIGVDEAHIARELAAILDDEALYKAMAKPSFAYGDGHAAARITESMCTWLEN